MKIHPSNMNWVKYWLSELPPYLVVFFFFKMKFITNRDQLALLMVSSDTHTPWLNYRFLIILPLSIIQERHDTTIPNGLFSQPLDLFHHIFPFHTLSSTKFWLVEMHSDFPVDKKKGSVWHFQDNFRWYCSAHCFSISPGVFTKSSAQQLMWFSQSSDQ